MMSETAAGRVGVVVLLVLLAAAVVVPLLPGDPGAVRLAGVGALWWFAACAAPGVATLAACALFRPRRNVVAPRASTTTTLRAVATWASPVVLTAVAARVFAGTPEAPVLVLTAAVAPLLALLAPSTDPVPAPNPVAGLAAVAAVGLVLWANLAVVADVARLAGVPRHAALTLSAAAVFLGVAWRAARRPVGDAAVLVGAAGVAIPLVLIGAAIAVPPWTAWSRTAARPALTFGEGSAWVTDGRRLERSATLVFTEPHRVTALSPGVYRVLGEVAEEGAPRSVTREWRLTAGDALTLRPGDRLVLDAGTRVRFEAGKRVPGSAASGVVWAEPPERRSLETAAHALGAVVTLVGGALALLPRPRALAWRRAVAGPAFLTALMLAAVSWGAYGVYAAPELALGAVPTTGLVELPAFVLPSPVGRALVVTSVLALLVLSVATALALREVLAIQVGPANVDVAWGGLVMVAAVAGLWPADPWRTWLAGCGLVAAAVTAPRLAGGGGSAGVAGSLVGAAAFVGLAAFGGELPAWAGTLAAYPAVLAAPLAWVAVRTFGVRGVAGAARG
jgi:hypothetical protein